MQAFVAEVEVYRKLLCKIKISIRWKIGTLGKCHDYYRKLVINKDQTVISWL